MSGIGHKAILASAGSGKTFQLAHRYIRLLAEKDGAGEVMAPDRICAMTFTRKAAGEIFDSIADYLRMAASDPEAARITAEERINMPHLNQEDFLQLLKRFISDLHRARISTLDSFIIGIAKAFPLELGIPLDFQVTDSDSVVARENRRAVLDRILGPLGGRVAGRTFLQAFKNATYGQEEKSFGKLLDSFLDNLRVNYRLCPDGDRWGNEDRIWPGRGCPWKVKENEDLSAVAATIRDWIEGHGASDGNAGKFVESLGGIAAGLAGYGARSGWEKSFDGTMLTRLLEIFPELEKGEAQITYNRKAYSLPAPVAGAFHALIRNLLAVEFTRALNRTRGLFDLLSTYERTYEEVTRATGSFSFTDIQYLLTAPLSAGGGRLISRLPGMEADGVDRLYIDYRMDCKLDHWLLDEFQDTSDLQWAVFENLISEIVQAPSGENRSFFYVGDVKQAIYRWRGGNHELFHRIISKFNEFSPVIALQPMQETRRCSQPVTDAVNEVFGSLPANLPPAALEKWRAVWESHKTAATERALGYVTLLESPDPVSGSEAEEARYQLVADLLNEIQPVRRGLDVGILVRQNEGGKRLVNVLRRECPEMTFVHEGEAAVTENEIVQVLLSLVRMAAHPGDEFAWKYLQMSPMSAVLQDRNIGRANIAPRLLAEIQEDGFQSFVQHWGGLLSRGIDVGPYGRECLARFESAAAEFDGTGARGSNSFLRFMESYTIREQPSGSAVRVMTVHQSKGLEFDIVILPELQDGRSGNMVKASRVDLVTAGDKADPNWILRMPKKMIAECDATLQEQLLLADAEHCFDSLCLLYVAMTRAKRGLYMVTSRTKGKSDVLYPSDFLKGQLSGGGRNVTISGNEYVSLFESGKGARWYEKKWPEKELEISEERAPGLPAGYADAHERRPVLHHREPSKHKDMTRNAARLFEAESSDIMDFGSAIHELLEQVEWIGDADVERIIREWEPTSCYDPSVTRDVITQFRTCMAAKEVRDVLSRPAGCVDQPWREKRFEIILDGQLVSGAFDRVTIIRDAGGVPLRAAILDYKSSVVDTDEKIARKVRDYTPQMTAYREALSSILNLPKDRIILQLFFTRRGVIREI